VFLVNLNPKTTGDRSKFVKDLGLRRSLLYKNKTETRCHIPLNCHSKVLQIRKVRTRNTFVANDDIVEVRKKKELRCEIYLMLDKTAP
jgi:hypothetical protein